MDAVAIFEGWHEFYFLLGTSAAGLTGLMFVVVSISPETIATRPHAGIRAFVTPIVVYFTSVLLISGAMMAPHPSAALLATLLALGALAGIAYMLWIDVHRQWRVSELEWDDWAWYCALPLAGYLVLLVGAIALWMRSASAVLAIALSCVLFVVVGIRNGWDLALWMARRRRP